MALDIESLRERFKSIDWEEVKKSWALEEEIKNAQKKRLEVFLDKVISSNMLKAWEEKFLAWETKYEDYYYYKKNTQTCSNIFDHLMSVLEKRGTYLSVGENFLSTAFKWGDYTFKLYCGQGCFWRVYKNEEIIFQGH